jgi:DNA-directed RNA polymerase specialized sigma24 family protein
MLALHLPNLLKDLISVGEKMAIREVTQEQFELFLNWLCDDREKAGEEYERLRFRLMTFFSVRRARFPEELADETINRVILKIGDIIIENKLGFIYGVAKNIFLESLRKEKEHLNVDDISIAAPVAVAGFSNECLNKCLGQLPADKRSFILDYFSESKAAKVALRKEMSGSAGASIEAVRMQVVRIKRKLKICVEECMN